MIFVAVLISNFGYHAVSVSQSLEAALVGQRIINIGAIFAPVLMLFCSMRLCKIRVPKILVYLLISYSLLVTYYSFTIGVTGVFYEYVSLEERNGVSYLHKHYGPAHVLYEIHVFGNMVATVALLIYSLFKKKNASHKLAICLIMVEFTLVVMYLVNRIFNAYVFF